MPNISVILPVYNSSETILESLKSISNQTYKDFEIIAINDGSTDNSLEILNEYKKIEPRLRVISRDNMGLPFTLNEGIRLAKGEYIARMDADDICFPERFEKQILFLESNNIDVCGTQTILFDKAYGKSNLPITKEGCMIKLLFTCPFYHPTIMGKRELFVKYKYNEKLDCSQDYELWCRMISNGIKMTNMKDLLLYYRISSNQIVSKKSNKIRDYSIETSKKYWKSLDLTSKFDVPNFMRTLDYKDSKQIYDCFNILNSIFTRIKTQEARNIITTQKYRLLLNTYNFDFLNLLSLIKHQKDIIIKNKILALVSIILNLSKIKGSIKKYREATRFISRLINYE